MDGAGLAPRRRWSDDRIAAAAIVIAVVPIVVAAVRAVVDGWLPLGDNAYFTIRSRDVLGPAHPLLGAWSSGSAAIGTSVNNLGPLQLDLLAPFTKLAPAAGTVIGVAAVNVASVVGIGVVTRRIAGSAVVVVTMAAASLLAWTMGSALLIEPRQHHALLLPFLAYLVMCWGAASGMRWCLPWAALLASLIIQTHFSYLLIVPIVSVWAVAATIVHARRSAAEGADGRWWSPLRGPAVVTIAVLAVCWAQSLVDQFFETGNLGRVREATGGGEPGPGVGTGVRIVASVVAVPVRWLRGGFRHFDPAGGLLGGVAAALVLVATAAVLIVAALRSRALRDWTASMAVGTAAVAIVAAILAAGRTPAGQLGLVAGNYRWLWPIAVFTATAVSVGLVDGAARSRRAHVPSVASGVAGVVLIVLAIANLPSAHQVPVVVDDLPRRPITEALLEQLDDVELAGPLLVDRSRGLFGEPYTYAVLLDLQRRGIDFTFDTAADVSRFGESRADDGRADQTLIVVTGPAARDEIPTAERIALAAGLDATTLSELAALRVELIGAFADGRFEFTADGRSAVAAGDYPAFIASAPVESAAFELGVELRRMFEADHLAVTAHQRTDLLRWIDLADRDLNETVALFLGPAR